VDVPLVRLLQRTPSMVPDAGATALPELTVSGASFGPLATITELSHAIRPSPNLRFDLDTTTFSSTPSVVNEKMRVDPKVGRKQEACRSFPDYFNRRRQVPRSFTTSLHNWA
jgi:hypothetical protein